MKRHCMRVRAHNSLGLVVKLHPFCEYRARISDIAPDPVFSIRRTSDLGSWNPPDGKRE